MKKTELITPILIVLLFIWLFFKPNNLKIVPKSTIKTIEKRIESKDTTINNYTTKVVNSKKIIEQLQPQIDSLRFLLLQVKNQKDTFQIVQIQDTLIGVLTVQNDSLKGVVNWQDSIIVAQRYIINSKDTIISLIKLDSKKYKRQRNWSIAGNVILGAGLGAALIFK